MYRLSAIVAVFSLLFCVQPTYGQELSVGRDGSIRNADSRAMVTDGRFIYLATRSEVYKAAAGNEKWVSIFSLAAANNEVTCLAGRGRNILVGTRRGIFRSEDGGNSWKNVFRTVFADKGNVISIDISRYDPGKIVALTMKGVFISHDSGGRWKEISGNLKNKSLKCIAFNKGLVYAGGEGGLYAKKEDFDAWERLYVGPSAGAAGGDEPEEPVEEPEYQSAVNCIAIKDSKAYIGVNGRILYSETGLKDWRAFEGQGLSGIVNDLVISKKGDRLYCATSRGIFEFNKEKSRWFELYKGMDKAGGASDLVLNDEEGNSLWALTEKGVYRLDAGRYIQDQYVDVERNMRSLKIIFDGEPSYIQLQKAALKFNEVDPEKIRKWRQESRLRALLPKISMGVDRKRSSNSEIYTSATKEYVYIGPDDESNGLDVSVSWELGDLIWSDDQTNIDVRSRLTTQLRNDILDDLRRVYYERKRLQLELMQAPPQDSRLLFEKQMRIHELTQAIDDLTGNYLSGHIEPKEDMLLNGGK